MDVSFYGIRAGQILSMPFENLAEEVKKAAKKDYLEIIVELTERRLAADTDVEKVACSRIISSLMDGPDVLDF